MYGLKGLNQLYVFNILIVYSKVLLQHADIIDHVEYSEWPQQKEPGLLIFCLNIEP